MVRKHLDYVTRFRFQPVTGDADLDDQLERLMDWRGRASNWDVCGRHNRQRFMRLLEASRVIDGDVGTILLSSGLLQAIEGDRITWPTSGTPPASYNRDDWIHGIKTTTTGANASYMVCNRSGQGLVFNRAVRANNMHFLAYYDRFDQVRGISPLASALNTITDLYETLDYTRIKSKMHAMLGVFLARQPVDTDSDGFQYSDQDDGEAPDSNTDAYDFELQPGLKIEGLPGDTIQTIESKNPSQEFQDFTALMIQIAILALDLPFTQFDSRKSSYSAQRQDLLAYQKSVRQKQDDLREFLDRTTAWDIARWNATGLLQLPSGMLPRDVKWHWVSEGNPWLDPMKEVGANIQAVSAGFTTRDNICREVYGTRFIDVVEQLGREEALAEENSATLAIGQPGQTSTRDEEQGNPANETGE